jgi:hypothetical protein
VFLLFVEIGQQYFNEPRDFAIKDNDNNTEWYSLQNTKGFIGNSLRPSDEPPVEKINEEPNQEDEILKQQWDDYNKLMTQLSDEESVYFKFRIEIETNSTLPMDQQSLANLGMQLAQNGRIDTRSLLEFLHIPGVDRIIKRLKEEAEDQQRIAGGPPGGPAGPASPLAAMGGQNG